MKQTRLMMDMPITIDIVDTSATQENINRIFDYFHYVDETFSPFKVTSEVSQINDKKLSTLKYSRDMKKILDLAQKTKSETRGYFEIYRNGKMDPSGIVKGWAIYNAATMLKKAGFHNYFVDAGGDIQVSGVNTEKKRWKIGIRNPFNRNEIVKVIYIKGKGVATSGTYVRGNHIYNPKNDKPVKDIVSLTVIGPNILEADRFATAAFAMGKKGIDYISGLPGFEGYLIDDKGIATYTSGFDEYTKSL